MIENRKPFAPVFGDVYENEGGGAYRCIDRVPLDRRSDPCDALMQSITVTTWGAWTFRAKGVHIYPNGKIDWNYSTGGAWKTPVFATLADCADAFGNPLPLQKKPTEPVKFKVGDKVVGNKAANKYRITKEGWTGYVRAVYEYENDYDVLLVSGGKDSGAMFHVYSYCFELAEG